MKYFLIVVAAMTVVLNMLAKPASAQPSRTDGGLIVIEDSLLSSNRKQIVFVVAKEILEPVWIEFQTTSSEGIVNRFTPINFPQGLQKGQIVPVWNGEFNKFHTTPWLRLYVTIFSPTATYYSSTSTPVQYREQYKEPMITSISESGGYGSSYTITVRGIFDTTEPSLVLINTGVFISPKAVTQTPPGIIQFTVPSGSFDVFPSGKYLLTICQAGRCDTMVGRHR